MSSHHAGCLLSDPHMAMSHWLRDFPLPLPCSGFYSLANAARSPSCGPVRDCPGTPFPVLHVAAGPPPSQYCTWRLGHPLHSTARGGWATPFTVLQVAAGPPPSQYCTWWQGYRFHSPARVGWATPSHAVLHVAACTSRPGQTHHRCVCCSKDEIYNSRK